MNCRFDRRAGPVAAASIAARLPARRRFTALLFAGLLFTGLLLAIPAPVGAAAPARTLLVYGDSLSAAYGIPQSSGWVSLLAARVKQEGLPWRVENASISGETTRGGRARLDAALARNRPAVVVLQLGANDGLRGLPVAEMRANLAAMTRAARKAGAAVVLVGMKLPPNYGAAYTRDFEAAYRELARTEKLRLVPFLLEGIAERQELFQTDTIHPVAAAQGVLLENVWRELKPLLRAN